MDIIKDYIIYLLKNINSSKYNKQKYLNHYYNLQDYLFINHNTYYKEVFKNKTIKVLLENIIDF